MRIIPEDLETVYAPDAPPDSPRSPSKRPFRVEIDALGREVERGSERFRDRVAGPVRADDHVHAAGTEGGEGRAGQRRAEPAAAMRLAYAEPPLPHAIARGGHHEPDGVAVAGREKRARVPAGQMMGKLVALRAAAEALLVQLGDGFFVLTGERAPDDVALGHHARVRRRLGAGGRG